MSAKPVSVSPDDTLTVVKQIFDNVKFHHVLVVEKNILIGVLSDRDLFKALSPHIGTAAETARDLATLNKKVHQVMLRKPVTLQPEAKVMDAIQLFNDDPGTEAIIMIGEIGGTAEEEAAEYIGTYVKKPVIGFIAGRTAPPGRRMGHAGAIISGGKGTAGAKVDAMRAAGILVADSPAHIGRSVAEALGVKASKGDIFFVIVFTKLISTYEKP